MSELQLVNQVEFKLLLISDPAKFSAALNVYLTPLLLKLGSESPEVRSKVLSILSHINSRLGSDTKLPLDKLLAQLHEPSLSSLIKTVDLTYIKKSIGQGLPDLLVQLSNFISKQTTDVAQGQFSLFLTALIDTPSVEFVPQDPQDLEFLLQKTTRLLLLDLKFAARNQCPGLATADYQFLNQDMTEARLSDAKAKVVKWWEFLSRDTLKPAQLYLPLLLAQADRLQSVYSPARALWKSLGLQQFELTAELATQLALLATPRQTVSQVKGELTIRIFDILAAADWSAIAGIDLYGLVHPALQSTEQKWVVSALKLLRTAVKKNKELEHAAQYVKDVYNYIYTLGMSYGSSTTNVRSSAYETLGMLMSVGPITELGTVNFLLQSLERDSPQMLPSIQSALGEVMSKEIPGNLKEELSKSLFKLFISADRDGTRYSCVRYMIKAFPFEDVKARLVCLLALSPSFRSDVVEEGKRGTNPYLFAMERSLDADALLFPNSAELCLLLDENKSHIPSLGAVIAFIFQCVGLEAGMQIPRDKKWDETFWVSVEHDDTSSSKLKSFLEDKDVTLLLSLCIPGLLRDDTQSTKVWSLLLRAASRETRLEQTKHVPDLIGAMNSKSSSLPVAVLAESIAMLYPDTELESFSQSLANDLNPNNALLLAYLVKIRNVRQVPLDFCIENKLYDAIYQLALGQAFIPDSRVKEVLNLKSEKSMLAYGALSITDADNASEYLETLLKLDTSSKNIDFLLANGEALSIAASGWDSALLKLERRPSDYKAVDQCLPALKQIFKDAKASPVKRRYACVRLLCLCQYNREQLGPYIADIQSCFLTFLSDVDEISQESASRGLGILFEYSDRATQKELVQRLVLLFTDDSTKTLGGGRISGETELFTPGTLKTGEGSVSTYKDVLNLANEVGDSSLVYKFMSLASSSQMWSTKRGAAFGLENIMARAEIGGDLVSPESKIGKNLVPKLFRYLFDSNQTVRNTMKSIWDALVKDRQKTIAAHFDTIMKELIAGTSNYEWRTREASTSALTNLVETMDWKIFQPFAEDMWRIGFRMVDDIKDSVRTAGFSLTKALVQVLTRRLDSQATGNKDLLELLIPFLFSTKGVHNESEEVRAFALSALLKIATSKAKDVEPFLIDMIEQLVLLLSDLEPQAMNYLALNSNNFGVEASMVDESRMQQVKRSPILESVEKVVDSLSNKQMLQVLDRWPQVVHKAVGLPSEIGTSRIIVSICMRFPTDPSLAPLMKECFKQLRNRNPTVSQNYAVALAYISRLSPLMAVKAYVQEVVGSYFDPESEDPLRLVTAQCMDALSKHASDKFLSLASLTLAFVAVGKEDGVKEISNLFGEVWDSNTGGSESLKLYSSEIIALSAPHLSSTAWNLRGTCARAIGKASPFLKETDNALVEKLLTGLQGRTWPGKENIYVALAKATAHLSAGDIKEKAIERSINELQRNNGDYVVAILPSAGFFLANNPNEQLFNVFYQRVADMLAGKIETDDEVTEEKKIEVYESAIAAYKKSFELEDAVDNATLPMFVGWKLKQAACNGIAVLGERGHFNPEIWQQACKLCGQDYGHEIVRLAWLKAASALKQFGVQGDVKRVLEHETSNAVKAEANNLGL